MELNELGGVRDRGLEVQNNHPVIRQLYRGLSENITKYRTMNTLCTTQSLYMRLSSYKLIHQINIFKEELTP